MIGTIFRKIAQDERDNILAHADNLLIGGMRRDLSDRGEERSLLTPRSRQIIEDLINRGLGRRNRSRGNQGVQLSNCRSDLGGSSSPCGVHDELDPPATLADVALRCFGHGRDSKAPYVTEVEPIADAPGRDDVDVHAIER